MSHFGANNPDTVMPDTYSAAQQSAPMGLTQVLRNKLEGCLVELLRVKLVSARLTVAKTDNVPSVG